MAKTTLTEAQLKKLDGVVEGIKVPADPEQQKKNIARYAEQYLRFALGQRPSTPDNHGLGQAQRAAIEDAVRAGMKLKASAPTVAGRPKAASDGK